MNGYDILEKRKSNNVTCKNYETLSITSIMNAFNA